MGIISHQKQGNGDGIENNDLTTKGYLEKRNGGQKEIMPWI